MNKIILFFVIFFVLIGFNVPRLSACTVWGASGQKVSIKGTIIAKNRDNLPNLFTSPRLLVPQTGFKVFALYDTEAEGYVVGGINEKGLAALNSSAYSVSKDKRHVATEDLTERILTTFASVDAVFLDLDVFAKSHPALYMIADSSKIATIEVAPGGKIAAKMINDGTAAFTNHYTNAGLLWANEYVSEGSRARLKHIQRYLTSSKRPYTMDDFILKSTDRTGGPDYALWRTGSTPEKVRTLASIVISIPASGFPKIYVRIANPDEAEQIYTSKLDFSSISLKSE